MVIILFIFILIIGYTSPNLAHVILELSLPHLLPTTPSSPSLHSHILSSLNPSQQASLAHTFTQWLTNSPSLLLSPPSSSANTLIAAVLSFSVSQPIRDSHSFYLSPATAAHAALMHVLWESPSHPSLSPSSLLASIHALATSVVAEAQDDHHARECAADRFAQVVQMIGGKGDKQVKDACAALLLPLPSTLLVSTVRQHLASA